jgi:hypothetical protein
MDRLAIFKASFLNSFVPRGHGYRVMKLENFSNLFFVVSVFVPGFIYSGVIANFIPSRRAKEKEALLLRYFTATAINYSIWSPLINLLNYQILLAAHPVRQGLCWIVILFNSPVILALANARLIQRGTLEPLYRFLRLRSISPIPTGWDWIFSTTDPCFVLITLKEGTEIAGYFGDRSMASSDPEHRDIYIERVYKLPENGAPWVQVERSLGMYVEGSQIAHIEFRE